MPCPIIKNYDEKSLQFYMSERERDLIVELNKI